MSKLTSFPSAMLLGAGLMYFLDPVRGARRRKRINEALMHAERVEREMLGKAARDAKHRIHGLTERVKHRPSTDAPDAVIEERVRARLGRAVSHPGAIEVVANNGRVILRGQVLTRELDAVLRAAKRVSGVREVIDRLERHDDPGMIPALQGEGRLRRAREQWSPALQAGATGAGALMMLYGALIRRGLIGTLLTGAGGALAMRGTLNRPMPELLGRRGGIHVIKTITVNRPIESVFDLWSRFDNFPLFMQHVQEVDVQLGGRRTKWTVDGPAGSRLQFEAEVIEHVPDKVIAWKTIADQKIEHEGRVLFEEVEEGTRVTVQMSYHPPGGVIGHAIAHLLGWDPKARMNDDLVRMKALLEEGRTRAHRQVVELADLH